MIHCVITSTLADDNLPLCASAGIGPYVMDCQLSRWLKMERVLLLLVVCAVFLSSSLGIASSRRKEEEQTVILVSFDAFRWDYLYRGHTPALEKIALGGARVKHLKNVFPTKTYPNHYSLVTGLYPESHGIVANTMYDPVLKEYFTFDSTGPAWFNEAEPIWVTLRNRGLVTAAVNFPGTAAEIHGVRPNFWNPSSLTMPYHSRVDKAITWLTQDQDRPSFIALYFEEPDESGHLFGPNGVGTMRAVKRVDDVAGYLMQRLRENGLLDSVNVLFTSDHGMVEQSSEREIYLDDLVDSSLYELIDSSPLAAILPHEGRLHEVFKTLHGAHPNLTVMYREDVPARLHYKHNRRIQPILALADSGWSIYTSRTEANKYRNESRGAHGYDNAVTDVHPYFIATGPAFKRKFVIPTMSSLDIYPLIFNILGEKPLPCNGTMEVAKRLLRSEQPDIPPLGSSGRSDILSGKSERTLLRETAGTLLLTIGGIALLVGALLATRSS